MTADPMTMERVDRIVRELDEAWGDREMMGNMAGDCVRDLCTALREAWKERDELREAIAFAHGRLESESEGCPPPEKMAESLRMLADERAGWIEVAIGHNKQCGQLQGKPTVTTEVEHLRAQLAEAQRDSERLEWLCRLIADRLEEESLLEVSFHLFGDAPCDECREAVCQHVRTLPHGMGEFRASIDGARSAGIGWTMASVFRTGEESDDGK